MCLYFTTDLTNVFYDFKYELLDIILLMRHAHIEL